MIIMTYILYKVNWDGRDVYLEQDNFNLRNFVYDLANIQFHF